MRSGTYHSPRRTEQAAATRAAIIDAASRLFAERGYAATTMTAIAAEARVAVKSVYTLAEKPQLLLLAVDRAIVGDDEPVALADRPEMRAIVDAAEPVELARRAARLGARTLIRLYPIYRAFEQAAAAEPTLAAQWRDYQQRRRDDVRRIVEVVGARTGLRAGSSIDLATDSIWALLTWHPVALLVEQRGWTEAQLADLLEELFVSLLLLPSSRGDRAAPDRTKAKPRPTNSQPAKSQPAKTPPAKTQPATTRPAKSQPAKSQPARRGERS